MEMTGHKDDEALYLFVDADRIDASVAIQFKDAVCSHVGDTIGRVVLDLSKVEFLDSSGLGAVVASMKLLGPDRKLELAGLTPAVAKVFRLTRMDRVFKVHDSVDYGGTVREIGGQSAGV